MFVDKCAQYHPNCSLSSSTTIGYGIIDIPHNLGLLAYIFAARKKIARKYFRGRIFSREDIFAGRYFRVNSIFAKISSRENISNSLFAKFSSRENKVLYSIQSKIHSNLNTRTLSFVPAQSTVCICTHMYT